MKSWTRFVAVWIGAAIFGMAYGAGWIDVPGPSATAAMATPSTTAKFSLCFSGGGHNCVVDGDTIWLDGQKVRIADIDTPETHDPKCAAEKELGDRATVRLQHLLNSGSINLQSIGRDVDSYGRKLRVVVVNGSSVGDVLVGEGLARPYGSGRRPWC